MDSVLIIIWFILTPYYSFRGILPIEDQIFLWKFIGISRQVLRIVVTSKERHYLWAVIEITAQAFTSTSGTFHLIRSGYTRCLWADNLKLFETFHVSLNM